MKNPILAALLVSVSVLLPTSLSQPAPGVAQDPAPIPKDFHTEIFHAVLEGLYDDGVRNDTLDLILANDGGHGYLHFVPGCPTCVYVLEAMRHYRARPDFVSFKGGGNTWGDGLSKEERAQFASKDMKTRLEGLHALVERWMEKRMDRQRLNKKERAAWSRELQRRAKEGMKLLGLEREAGGAKQWQDFDCPSCVGAIKGAGGDW